VRPAISRLANAAAERQMVRPFARYFVHGLSPMERAWLRSLLFSAAEEAVEEWERARPVRERAAFYNGEPT